MTMQLEMNLQDDAALDSPAEAIHTPAIRFKGFSGDWKTKPFNELCWFQEGPGLRQWQFTNHGIKVINVTNLENGVLRLERTNRHISLEEFKKTYKHFEIDENDIVIASSGNSYGKVAIVRQQDLPLVMNTSVIRFKPLNDLNYDYLLTFLKSSQFKSQIDIFITGGAQPNFGPAHLNKTKINIPANIGEQTKIGNYFQQLDSLIAQQQHKHTKLLNLKQALLQKMFPKQGATVPEVRFQGFSGDWEEQKWRESVDISREMVDPKNGLYDELFHIGPGNIESFTGRIYNNVLRVKDSNLISGKFYFKKGDIIYGKINPQLAKQIIAPFEGLASADAYILNAKNETAQSYLYVILQTGNFYKYSVSVSARTGMPKINREELDLYTYQAPKKLEQTKIGNLFQQLDHLITQQHALLTKLGNLKQAYLAKMFV